jgi:hypothetical protein
VLPVVFALRETVVVLPNAVVSSKSVVRRLGLPVVKPVVRQKILQFKWQESVVQVTGGCSVSGRSM